jgi:hypothetical protein
MAGKEGMDKTKACGSLWLFPTKSLAIKLPEGASLVFDTRVPHCVRVRRPRRCDILTVVRLGFPALVY